jgi:hypothetical protein
VVESGLGDEEVGDHAGLGPIVHSWPHPGLWTGPIVHSWPHQNDRQLVLRLAPK